MDKFLNVMFTAVNPHTIQLALVKSGVTWHVPLPQLMSLEVAAHSYVSAVAVVDTDKPKELSPWEGKHTLFGIPLVIDSSIPETCIELRVEDETIFRIENLAVPCYMGKE